MSEDFYEYDTCVARALKQTSWMLTRDMDYTNLCCWGWWPEVERMRRKNQAKTATVVILRTEPPKEKPQRFIQTVLSHKTNSARPNVTIRRQKTLQQPQRNNEYFKK